MTVTEIKKATEELSPEDRWEFFVWLRQREDVRGHQHDELQRDISAGLEQAERGEIALLNISSVKEKVRQLTKQT